ncbi:MAG TPA: hypothetical protein V6D10_17675 [Trichocoleus sp.]|jgi:hypothetical protein
MDEQNIQTLFEQLKTDILAEVDRKNQGVASSLSKEFKKSISDLQKPAEPAPETEEVKQEKLSMKALQQEIQQLRQELGDKDKKAFLADKNAAVSKAIASAKALNPLALQKLFTLQVGEFLKREGEQWFVESGDNVKSLDQVLADYLASEEGQLFVPPSGVNGSSSQETKATPAPANHKPTSVEAVNAAFANF